VPATAVWKKVRRETMGFSLVIVLIL